MTKKGYFKDIYGARGTSRLVAEQLTLLGRRTIRMPARLEQFRLWWSISLTMFVQIKFCESACHYVALWRARLHWQCKKSPATILICHLTSVGMLKEKNYEYLWYITLLE
jgi:hypothetical protein